MFNKVMIFLLQACLWWPQILENTINGIKYTPNYNFVVAQTFYVLFLPLYFKAQSQNILFLEPQRYYVLIISAWVGLQLAILKKQQSKPRFLIPRFLRHRIFSHIYIYKRYFADEVDNLSSAQLYQSMTTQDEERLITE